MDYKLPNIPYLKLKFYLTAVQNCRLNSIKGSMLRGAFGHALKRTVCVMKQDQPCESCMLRQQCAYTRIFETFIEGPPPPFLRGLQTSPRPIIIDAQEAKTYFNEGESFGFHLTLLGKAHELHPYVIFSVLQMANQGLTRRQVPFTLDKVTYLRNGDDSSEDHERTPEERLLYNGQTQCLCEAPTPSTISTNGDLSSPLTLRFLTPTRLKFRNELSIDFTFRMLVFKMIRRVLEIAYFYVPDARIDWEFHSLLERADQVHIAKKDLNWVDWERKSNRQQTEMKMGGFIGDMTLEGDISPFTELLRLSEMLHVGKGTMFGLGKVEMEETKNTC